MRVWPLVLISLLAACGGATAVSREAPKQATPITKPNTATTATSASATTSTKGATMTAEQALERLFTADRPSAQWFAPSFLAAVPVSKIEAITQQIRASNGLYKNARAKDGHWTVEFE